MHTSKVLVNRRARGLKNFMGLQLLLIGTERIHGLSYRPEKLGTFFSQMGIARAGSF